MQELLHSELEKASTHKRADTSLENNSKDEQFFLNKNEGFTRNKSSRRDKNKNL